MFNWEKQKMVILLKLFSTWMWPWKWLHVWLKSFLFILVITFLITIFNESLVLCGHCLVSLLMMLQTKQFKSGELGGHILRVIWLWHFSARHIGSLSLDSDIDTEVLWEEVEVLLFPGPLKTMCASLCVPLWGLYTATCHSSCSHFQVDVIGD